MLLLAVIGWVPLAYLASNPLGRIYGWSGHPPIPGAPTHVYVLVFLVLLPSISLLGSWLLVRWARSRVRRLRAAAVKLRPILVVWHRWFGLLAGLWLFALGLTGSILVFHDEIDQALNHDLLRVARSTGAILADRHPIEGSAGDRFLALQFPLHSVRSRRDNLTAPAVVAAPCAGAPSPRARW